ncbi:MAG TPA: hypothetical protein P5026_12185 [Kiritimatiellia bacterium]|nr:hypothetical protein [Kiritimatiellia bacterium]
MTAKWNALASLIVWATLTVGSARGGVYDDCVAWWHFDYDPNANGKADLDEIRDQRDWGTTAVKGSTGKHATAVNGASGGPQWIDTPEATPAGGQNFGRKSMLFQTAVDSQTTNCWPDTFRVSNLQLAGDVTLVTRFRWDGYPTESEKTSWLFNTGMEWNKYTGWLFGVTSNTYPRLAFYSQQNQYQMDVRLTNGVWYDAALVVKDNSATEATDTVEFYLWQHGGALAYRKYMTAAITNAIGTLGCIVGCETVPTTYASGNARKSFIGAVNHLAVWNRALSPAEINEAFGFPQPLFQIELKNNRPEDLRHEEDVDAEYLPGDPWHTMRRAVTDNNPQATVKLPLNELQAALGYVFHLRTQATDAGQPAHLRLIVNSVTNATRTVVASQDLFWYIAPDSLVNGTNTVTVQYVSGPARYVSFDWLELAGSWQVGYDNNSQAEFEMESNVPDDFYVTNPNWKHLERAISSGDTNVNVHFSLSGELAEKYNFLYTTRIISQGNGGTNHAFSVDINQTPLASFAPVPNGTLITLPISRGLMQPGDNMIKIRYDDDPKVGGYLQFDFHRLEILPFPKGTMLFLK